MKSVGKQLQEARLAKNWTPELASRETKIKVDRLRDLESDDYSHFSGPAYARGFVRTYARALGLDEYRILRQLDNKLPDDEAPILPVESSVNYLPETAMPPRVAHRNYTGLYILMALGGVVSLAIVFILFNLYRVGELPQFFSSPTPEPTVAETGTETNAAPTTASPEATARALPVDSNTPPSIDTPTAAPVAQPVDETTASVRAQPVNPADLTGAPPAPVAATTNVTPAPNVPVHALRALPVDASELTNAPAAIPPAPPVAPAPGTAAPVGDPPGPAPTPAPVVDPPAPGADPAPTTPQARPAPRALPVDPSELTGALPPTDPVAGTVPAQPVAPASAPAAPSLSARQANARPLSTPPAPPVAHSTDLPPSGDPASLAPPTPPPATTPTAAAQRLVLTASQDSFVSVTSLDTPNAAKPLYASVLHMGQSVGFDGHKFSINVGISSAVNIKLDSVNYGPHSTLDAPETFTLESHQP